MKNTTCNFELLCCLPDDVRAMRLWTWRGERVLCILINQSFVRWTCDEPKYNRYGSRLGGHWTPTHTHSTQNSQKQSIRNAQATSRADSKSKHVATATYVIQVVLIGAKQAEWRRHAVTSARFATSGNFKTHPNAPHINSILQSDASNKQTRWTEIRTLSMHPYASVYYDAEIYGFLRFWQFRQHSSSYIIPTIFQRVTAATCSSLECLWSTSCTEFTR